MGSHGPLHLELADGVARLTLASPATGNALDPAMGAALREVGRLLGEQDGLRVVRLGAEGRAFCVGGDLRGFAGVEDPAAHVAALAASVHDGLTSLRTLPVPVVSVVQGVAAGGGLGLALVADVVLVARSATMRVAYTAAGLSPDCGVTVALARGRGPAPARDRARTKRTLNPEQAEQWGLVSQAVDDDELEQIADDVVRRLAEGPHEALSATKRLVRAAVQVETDDDWRAHLDAEAVSIAHLAGRPDGREGVAAFLEKRAARFSR
jgi:2-(1,2-epoxy-1,2-dihydrophenyl)acetyl-CoA isomerase